jgi:hypothetical protein
MWHARISVYTIEHQSLLLTIVDMLKVKRDAKYARYSLNGTVYGVHAVAIDYEQGLEMQSLRQNYVR